MYGELFGEYLVKEGVISGTQLDKAIEEQRQDRELLGTLAVRRGYLTEQSLRDLLVRQAQEHRRLGELAVDSGACTNDQIRALLAEQAENHLCLGEALVRLSILDTDTLNRRLKVFHEKGRAVSQALEGEIDALPEKNLVKLGLEMVRAFVFRLGYVVKLNAISKDPPENLAKLDVFLAEQERRDGSTAYFGLALPPAVISLVLEKSSLKLDLKNYRNHIEINEYIEQVLYNLNYALCRQARASSIPIDPGAVGSGIPRGHRLLSFRLSGTPDPFYVVHYLPT